jgi:hypothetical protein
MSEWKKANAWERAVVDEKLSELFEKIEALGGIFRLLDAKVQRKLLKPHYAKGKLDCWLFIGDLKDHVMSYLLAAANRDGMPWKTWWNAHLKDKDGIEQFELALHEMRLQGPMSAEDEDEVLRQIHPNLETEVNEDIERKQKLWREVLKQYDTPAGVLETELIAALSEKGFWSDREISVMIAEAKEAEARRALRDCSGTLPRLLDELIEEMSAKGFWSEKRIKKMVYKAKAARLRKWWQGIPID